MEWLRLDSMLSWWAPTRLAGDRGWFERVRGGGKNGLKLKPSKSGLGHGLWLGLASNVPLTLGMVSQAQRPSSENTPVLHAGADDLHHRAALAAGHHLQPLH